MSFIKDNPKATFDTTNIIGLVVWMLCVFYNCVSSAVEVSKITNSESDKEGEYFNKFEKSDLCCVYGFLHVNHYLYLSSKCVLFS